MGIHFPTAPPPPATPLGSAPTKEEITQLKELLRKAGYDPGPAGGQWNATARKALAAFQKASGIVPASGLLNDASRIALGMPVASAGRIADKPSSVPPEKSVAMLGDSITANGGYGKDLQGHLRGWKFDNFGIVGNKTDQMNARLRADSGSVSARTVDLSKYKTLILLGGVNDIASGRSVAAIEKDLTAMYDRADAAGVRVIPMTVAPWKGYPSWSPANQAKTNELNAWIRAEAQRRHYPLVDLADALSARHDSPPGDPAALSTRYRGRGTEGLLHPGDEGQKEMGELIWRAAYQNSSSTEPPPEPR
jgi:hypothetical protein